MPVVQARRLHSMYAQDTLLTGDDLRSAVTGALDGLPPRQASQAVERLISHYRGRTPTDAPVLRDRSDVAAYAAYRMPATFEAVRGALAALAERVPDWAPASHLDIGGGTGAALWAAAATWPDTLASGVAEPAADADPVGELRRGTVWDWAGPALELGRELAERSPSRALRGTRWLRYAVGSAPEPPPDTDLVTLSYLLGELDGGPRAALLDQVAQRARAVVVVEPGTPKGYLRVRAARDQLIAAGLRVLAPCPHSEDCPIVPGTDWCHVAARVNRSALHRRIKGGSLGHEDEKYSYLVAVRLPAGPAPARVVRRPQQRKGQVLLDLCTRSDGLRRETVTKRSGPLYRSARELSWGAAWPPVGAERDDAG